MPTTSERLPGSATKGVAKVELSYGGNLVATSATGGLTYLLDTTTLSNGRGSSVTATATDFDGSIGSATSH